MKKTAAAIASAFVIAFSAVTAFASGAIADHSGTSMEGIAIGTEELGSSVKQYTDIFESAGEQYGVDPNLLAAICMQESSGRNLSYREDGSEYPAWGIMQIEKSLENSFAAFGLKTTGEEWTLEDRLDPSKAVPFAAHLISNMLIKYDCDYMKTVQAYNFGETVLNRIIEAVGDDWLSERANAKNYADNWSYDTYGDAEYIEHVFRYYHNDIPYVGAKVRLNGTLIDFDDQFPVIEDGRTLIPIRALSEELGADVEWNGDYYRAEIEMNGIEIILPINSTTAYVDGEPTELDVPAQIRNGRTMVPIRFIMEEFDVSVDWDDDTRTVLIEE
ncbi:MAG: transglycosylase SLT domain-containing protein [Firmicutes bacterium]|nr:transglycosylase SLT domain-containing protein [Bacillota bacterium]